MSLQSRSITRQAGLRLIFSLGLFVLLLGVSSYKLYSIALQKSAHERAEDLATFYRTRLTQMDRDWELQARDFKVRLEVTRLLEDRKTSVTNLQAFMTVQGTNRRFQYMLIQNRNGDKIFDFGTALDLDKIPVPSGQESSWYLSGGDGNLYRVFVAPIWLGEAGNGRMAVFYEIDNALLFNLATPGIVLTARNGGSSIASSAGQAGLERVKQPTARTTDVEEREIPWSTNASENTFLRIDAPIKVLFTTTELAVGAAMIPVIDGLILLFVLGFWLIRNARRIRSLGGAVEEFTAKQRPTATLQEKLHLARGGRMDEISDVACTIEDMAEQTQQLRLKTETLLHRNQTLMQNAMDGIHVMDMRGNIVEANDAFCHILGYTREEMARLNAADWDAQWSAEELRERFKELIGKNARFETVNRRKDGTLIDVEISANGMEIDGQYLLLASSRDITERKKAEQGMRDQQDRINGLVEAAMDAIVSTDENQNIIMFNHGAEQMFGYRAADILGHSLDLLVPIRFREKHKNHVDEFGKTGITSRTMNQLGETYGLRANGEEFPFEATISRVKVAGKSIYTAILRDTTLRKLTEAKLHIAAVAFESQEGMLITDANGVILKVNQAFTDMTGYTSEEAIGQTPRLLKSGRHDAAFYDAMWEDIQRTGTWQGEIWDRRKNGEVYPKLLTISAVKVNDGAVTHYVGSHIDITERKAAEQKIQYLAFYDALTDLPNRRLLLDRLGQALGASTRSGQSGALLFIGLDNFKNLNNTLGHDIGDLLLLQVAQRLISCARKGDTVARLGGDEFVVILEDLSEQALGAAAQTEAAGKKILAALNRPYQLAGHECHSASSIGATLFNDNQQTIDELMKQADIAVYQAKKAGRNTLRFFDLQMQKNINEHAALEDELRKALERQQFQLYYQIQMDSSNHPLGAEALIRWPHPEHGLVSPAQFISLAEETGLILPIGQWVLETACCQLKAWEQEALTRDLVLAVNVSAKQFRQVDFVEQVQAAVQRHAINPNLLKLELTESMLLENIEDIIATMSALKQTGIRFSLDDFGTGYSSLQYLKRLPLDQLKIDQSFVRDLVVDSSDKAIVRTIIAMAKSLNLSVIAEGVETEEQRQLLMKKGCTCYQGYLFGKPVPIEQFEVSLKRG